MHPCGKATVGLLGQDHLNLALRLKKNKKTAFSPLFEVRENGMKYVLPFYFTAAETDVSLDWTTSNQSVHTLYLKYGFISMMFHRLKVLNCSRSLSKHFLTKHAKCSSIMSLICNITWTSGAVPLDRSSGSMRESWVHFYETDFQ